MNENISNRKKFLDNFSETKVKCESYSFNKFVYLKRVFEVKNENLILFKLSNNDIQAFNYETNMSLLVTND